MFSSVSSFLLSFLISLFTSVVETAAIALQNKTYLNKNCNDSIKSKILRFKILLSNIAVQFVLLIFFNQPHVVNLFTPVNSKQIVVFTFSNSELFYFEIDNTVKLCIFQNHKLIGLHPVYNYNRYILRFIYFVLHIKKIRGQTDVPCNMAFKKFLTHLLLLFLTIYHVNSKSIDTRNSGTDKRRYKDHSSKSKLKIDKGNPWPFLPSPGSHYTKTKGYPSYPFMILSPPGMYRLIYLNACW